MAHLITTRRAKWATAIASVVIIATIAASAFFDVYVNDAHYKYDVALHGGNVLVGCRHIHHGQWPKRPLEWGWGRNNNGLLLSWPSWTIRPGFWFQPTPNPHRDLWVVIPLWPPLVLFTGIFICLARKDRAARRGRCRRCHYDLAGSPGPRCPECGTTPAASRHPPSDAAPPHVTRKRRMPI